MGRVDRYGGFKFCCYLILDEDNYYEKEWVRVLDSTLQVFNRSIASLQYLLDKQMKRFRSNFFQKGFHIFEELSEELTGQDGLIENELNRILNMESLDSIPYTYYRDFEYVIDFDNAVDKIKTPFLDWLEKTLGLDVGYIPHRDSEVIRFFWSKKCKIAVDNYIENLQRDSVQLIKTTKARRC